MARGKGNGRPVEWEHPSFDPTDEVVEHFSEIQSPKKRAYLAAYVVNGGAHNRACRAAGIDQSTPYTAPWKEDEQFQEAFEVARKLAADVLEAEAVRRAYFGTRKPVTYRGEITDWYFEHSDTLLLALLNAKKPHEYKRRHDITSNDEPVTGGVLVVRGQTPEEWREENERRRKGKME